MLATICPSSQSQVTKTKKLKKKLSLTSTLFFPGKKIPLCFNQGRCKMGYGGLPWAKLLSPKRVKDGRRPVKLLISFKENPHIPYQPSLAIISWYTYEEVIDCAPLCGGCLSIKYGQIEFALISPLSSEKDPLLWLLLIVVVIFVCWWCCCVRSVLLCCCRWCCCWMLTFSSKSWGKSPKIQCRRPFRPPWRRGSWRGYRARPRHLLVLLLSSPRHCNWNHRSRLEEAFPIWRKRPKWCRKWYCRGNTSPTLGRRECQRGDKSRHRNQLQMRNRWGKTWLR